MSVFKCVCVSVGVQVFLLKPNDKLLPSTATLKQREAKAKAETQADRKLEPTNNVNNSQKLIYTFVVSVTLYICHAYLLLPLPSSKSLPKSIPYPVQPPLLYGIMEKLFCEKGTQMLSKNLWMLKNSQQPSVKWQ